MACKVEHIPLINSLACYWLFLDGLLSRWDCESALVILDPISFDNVLLLLICLL